MRRIEKCVAHSISKIKWPRGRAGPTAACEARWVGPLGSISLAGVGQDEVVELHLAGHFAGGGEKADEEFAEVVGTNAIEIVLAFAARFDESRDAEQSQVVTDGGLALAETIAEVGDVQFVVLGQDRTGSGAGSRRSEA